MLALSLVLPLNLLAQIEEVEPPWGTVNGNIAGTASTDKIPYLWGEGPMQVAWKLNVRAAGYDRVAGRNPITFDAAGNIYWKTSIGGGTGGRARVVSASPSGTIRWAGNHGAGNPHDLGAFFDGTAVVVGRNTAYALGGKDNGVLFIAAYDKETGSLIWETELDDAVTCLLYTSPSPRD